MLERWYRYYFHINAAHNMTPDAAENRHAHSFLVIAGIETLNADMEQQNGCEKALKHYLEQYAGMCLNETPRFAGKLPTIEVICEVFYEDMKAITAQYGMKLIHLEVGDSPIAMYAIGEKLLIGSIYQNVADSAYEEYKKSLTAKRKV